MELTTAKYYLLLTERIGKKPMLRTRFTNQAYFVFAALLDLIDQQIIDISAGQFVIKDQQKFDQLPAYLDGLKTRIEEEIQKGSSLTDALDLITSWDIANEIYDGVGAELLQAKLVDQKSVRTNLDTHVIYLPTDAARKQVVTYLKRQMASVEIEQSAMGLVVIYEQLDALKWLIPAKAELSELAHQFHQNVDQKVAYQAEKALVKTAQEIITKKKFWYDSWLS